VLLITQVLSENYLSIKLIRFASTYNTAKKKYIISKIGTNK